MNRVEIGNGKSYNYDYIDYEYAFCLKAMGLIQSTEVKYDILADKFYSNKEVQQGEAAAYRFEELCLFMDSRFQIYEEEEECVFITTFKDIEYSSSNKFESVFQLLKMVIQLGLVSIDKLNENYKNKEIKFNSLQMISDFINMSIEKAEQLKERIESELLEITL